jgi:fatty-acid desaturase|tara:strand:+ start:150 stop:407 length:258 start_codon:yes stop_codon:yes gene_type:complete
MNNPIKKVLLQKTKDWYIKWVASIILIVGITLTANNIYPLNLFFDVVGLTGWFIVAMLWNDHALIVINSVSIVILLNGILNYYVK